VKIILALCFLLAVSIRPIFASPQARILETGRDHYDLQAAFSPDGRFVTALTRPSFEERRRTTFRLFDAKTGESLAGWPLRNLQRVAVSPTDRTVAIITGERQRRGLGLPYAVELRDWKTGVLRRSLVKAGTVNAGFYDLCWSPDGRFVAASCGDGRVTIWNAHDGRKKATLKVGNFVDGMAWSPQGKWLVLGGYERLELWNWAQSQRISVFDGGSSSKSILKFSDDGRNLLWDDGYRSLRVLQVPTLALIAQTGHSQASLSPDGRRVAFWHDTPTGKNPISYDRDLLITDTTLKHQIWNLRLSGDEVQLDEAEVQTPDLSSDKYLRWLSAGVSDDSNSAILKLWQIEIPKFP